MDDLINYRFTGSDEWIRPKGDRIVAGLSDYAQSRMGDIVHVELPEPDDHLFEADEDIGVIQSLSATLEFHAPVTGTITRINTELLSRPELVNADPYGEGWIIEMQPSDPSELDDLMDVHEYESELPDDEDD
jgi:glycine cleavage system H protein